MYTVSFELAFECIRYKNIYWTTNVFVLILLGINRCYIVTWYI